MPIDTICIDLDGTLYDSENIVFQEGTCPWVNQFLTTWGIPKQFTPDELIEQYVGYPFDSTIRRIAADHGITLRDEAVQYLAEEELNIAVEVLRLHVQPSDGALAALDRVSRSYELALVSSSLRVRIDTCLEKGGLGKFFPAERRFSAPELLPKGKEKPEPDIYLLALQRMGASASTSVAIEDTVTGVTAAVRAGLIAVGYVGCKKPEQRAHSTAALHQAGATIVMDHWDQLGAVLSAYQPAPQPVSP